MAILLILNFDTWVDELLLHEYLNTRVHELQKHEY